MRLLLAASFAAALLAVGRPASPAPPESAWVTDADKERFLLEADVLRTRGAPGGVTGTRRATLREGERTHEASIQTIDQASSHKHLGATFEVDFRDTYKNNVAAYRLDRLLGLGMVPVTVVRPYERRPAAFTWWLDDMLMTEKERHRGKQRVPDVEAWNGQMFVVRVFDQLIFNFDRNLGNLLIDRQWRIWMIDHTRGFKYLPTLKSEKDLGERCERRLLAALRTLDKPTLEARMEGVLSAYQIEGLLARRDKIVAYYDTLIAARGADAVLYEGPAR
jgi:hypothetical protein